MNKPVKTRMQAVGIMMMVARDLHIIIKKSSIFRAHTDIETLKSANDPER
jgi:hypothetical protein